MVGADSEDIVQEGMIGIFKAIRSYDSTKQTSFHTLRRFASIGKLLQLLKELLG